MATAQHHEVKCPTCGKHQGVYEINTRTYEKWFVCLACGWGFQTTLRRFGEQSLSKLDGLMFTVSKLGRQPKPPEWSPELESLLTEIVEDCVKNGFRQDEEPLKTLNSILNRPVSERTSSDWQFLVEESSYRGSFFVLDENGKRIWDYVEEAPKLIRIPMS